MSDAGVRVRGVLEDLLDRPGLDDLALAHDRHAVGDVGDHTDVVGDQKHRDAELLLHRADHVEHLGLDRHIQRCRRFVGDDEIGFAGQSARDQHALRHPARDLVRVPLHDSLGIGDPHPLEQVARAFAGLLLRDAEELDHGTRELVPDREGRVEVRHRLLRNVGDASPPDAEHGLRVDLAVTDEHGLFEADGARQDARVLRQQAEDGERGLRLARPRLADQTQHLTRPDRERYVADHTGVLAVGVRVADAQARDLEDRLGVVDRGRLLLPAEGSVRPGFAEP